MRPRSNTSRWLCLVLLAALALAAARPEARRPKDRGGVPSSTRMLAEDPPGFSIHESSTISGVWPLSPLLLESCPVSIRSSRTSSVEDGHPPSSPSAGRGRTPTGNLVFFLR